MNCHSCKTTAEIEAGKWTDVPFNQTPCGACRLSQDSYGTLEYQEGHISNSSPDADNPDDEEWTHELADGQISHPFANLDGDNEDPQVPLSALVEAMQLWTRLSLPARKTFQMRMAGLPFAEIGKRLGFSRQMAEKLVSKAIAEDGRLQNLVPSKKHHASTPLSGSRKCSKIHSVVADSINSAEKGEKSPILRHNKPLTRTA
jgi:hypothetical protein